MASPDLRWCLACVAAAVISTVGCSVGADDGGSGLSGGPGGLPADGGANDDDGGASGDSGSDSPTTGGITEGETGAVDPSTGLGPDSTDGGDDQDDDAETTVSVDDEGQVTDTGDTDDGGESSSTGAVDVDVGTQPNVGEYSHCLSNAMCNVGSCMTLGNPVSDGFCSLTCSGVGNPAPCGPAPVGSPLSPTCYGADNGMGGAVYVCALGCADDQPCPAGMECFSVPQAAAAGGGTLDFCA